MQRDASREKAKREVVQRSAVGGEEEERAQRYTLRDDVRARTQQDASEREEDNHVQR